MPSVHSIPPFEHIHRVCVEFLYCCHSSHVRAHPVSAYPFAGPHLAPLAPHCIEILTLRSDRRFACSSSGAMAGALSRRSRCVASRFHLEYILPQILAGSSSYYRSTHGGEHSSSVKKP
eukprot:COSAG02_NODE_6632_length_3449_cov_1.459403_2_plen_119_part_00